MKRFILITGASGEIGGMIAQQLAKQGYSLYLHYNKNEQGMTDLLVKFKKLESNQEFIPIQADLTTTDGIGKLCSEIFQLHGLVHNSGIAISKMLIDMKEEEINRLISLHLTAPIQITKILLPKMIRNRNGNIVFISSIWGQTGASCETVYSAVKGGQISFAKALSKELASSGIRVNVVAPGAIDTKMLSNLTEDDKKELIDEIPIGKIGTPKDVAQAVTFLLSEQASYITGHVLNVNGGWYV
ncbi:elongation factor P 5-aminopentanone reductase [Fervidibacillus halotolerans]|uniref:SDR family oxidoreductase n=1 Tax=Fervidibacillus halotolerans TaxID=2980027 RepID=A0A9E8M109_9BACI|nr:SDR family oxidoreductase [Fervidibacillus halotolerans]WAA13543.1 SDR family oxidoreductase [Fervidibacillus halotolerans]